MCILFNLSNKKLWLLQRPRKL